MDQIGRALEAYLTIRQRIIAIEADIDEGTLADTVDGLTDLHEVIAAVVRSALIDEAMAEGLKGHIHALQDRRARLAARAEKSRQIARDAMLDVDLKKIAAPDFTVSMRAGSAALVVVEEGAVPSQYWEPREPRLDRLRLLSDLKKGVEIAGASLSNPEPTLTVRGR